MIDQTPYNCYPNAGISVFYEPNIHMLCPCKEGRPHEGDNCRYADGTPTECYYETFNIDPNEGNFVIDDCCPDTYNDQIYIEYHNNKSFGIEIDNEVTRKQFCLEACGTDGVYAYNEDLQSCVGENPESGYNDCYYYYWSTSDGHWKLDSAGQTSGPDSWISCYCHDDSTATGCGPNEVLMWGSCFDTTHNQEFRCASGDCGDLSGQEIPESICQLEARGILLENNGLVGSIPDCIGNMPNPQFELLTLEDNNLTGTVPVGLFTNLTYLSTLKLQNNQLSGEIPVEFCSSPVLTYDFSGNDFCSADGGLWPLYVGGAPYFQCYVPNWWGQQQGGVCDYEDSTCDCGDIVYGCMDAFNCNYNASATIHTSSDCLENDCSGECGGTTVNDCTGNCGGSVELDSCGYCDGNDSSCDLGCGPWEPGPSGCDNVCYSTLENDDCGVCGGPGLYPTGEGFCYPQFSNYLTLCSTNVMEDPGAYGFSGDPMGACIGGSDGDFYYYCQWAGGTSGPQPCDCFGNVLDCTGECGGDVVEDCAGECGGSDIVDECGECGGDNSSCADCAGVPNGDSVEDDCGICGDGICEDTDDDGICNCVDDCDGVIDECGVCNGDNTSCADCAGVLNGDSELDYYNECCLSEDMVCGDCTDDQGVLIFRCAGTGTCPSDGDADGICDDFDDCVGEYDECGVCDGDNSTCGTVTDIDENVYQTVLIGEQWWMAENLKTDINNRYCYDDNESNCDTHGGLYQWEDALTVCPEGWYLPSDEEYTILIEHLGGESVAGGKLKDNINWNGTNESGFTAISAGYKYSGGYNYMGNSSQNWVLARGYFWSSTALNQTVKKVMYLQTSEEYVINSSGFNKSFGMSIRCLRDEFYCPDGQIFCPNNTCQSVNDITECSEEMVYNLQGSVTLIGIPLYLGEDSSLSSVFANTDVITVMGEGAAAMNSNGTWLGSLINVDPLSGYWVGVDQGSNETTTISITGELEYFETTGITHDLHEGANLISFTGIDGTYLEDALAGYEGIIVGVLSAGTGAMWYESQGKWIGSLTEFKRDKGYWVKTTQAIDDFKYGAPQTYSASAPGFTYVDILLPKMDQETLLYQNPANGVYEWSVIQVFDHLKKQLSGVTPGVIPQSILIQGLDIINKNFS